MHWVSIVWEMIRTVALRLRVSLNCSSECKIAIGLRFTVTKAFNTQSSALCIDSEKFWEMNCLAECHKCECL